MGEREGDARGNEEKGNVRDQIGRVENSGARNQVRQEER